ncbi:hypothetical protein EPK99_17165 [Neorhizobium lilium]|uniref:Farnesoic acid O-methyl transferase domain-containing protein n=1 Tax=Neorhizobium lilium TaxID=2503024 RepID=A0A444LC45_9HYPH|nr:hypothetical protein [Neorhizobium lilium]RWX75433.1 hypothetical protein EPK99_17165 [Neorhizobium lilium]
MGSVVLVTFAGRQQRMEILTSYVRKALERGLIDEWHIWDFTRAPEDHDWVSNEFGPVRYMHADVPYMPKGSLSKSSSFRMRASIGSDLHLALLNPADPDNFFEFIIGGWDNQGCGLRKLSREGLKTFDREFEPYWIRPTPGVLSNGSANDILLQLDPSGVPSLFVNGVFIGSWPEITIAEEASVMVRGGFGADLEILDVTDSVRRYIGQPQEKAPYYRSYDYYAKHQAEYAETVFLKCDDDIVYMDLDKLNAFIDFRILNPHYLVLSANVVNNVACAYWQQVAGMIPRELGQFEYPPEYGGSLWQSPEKANALHDFFLSKTIKALPLPKQVIEMSGARVSINFIAWLGKDLKHMSFGRASDERTLTLDLPAFLKRPVGIFSDFTVSHLSFGPQELGLHVERLLAGYEKLMRQTLGLKEPERVADLPHLAVA